MAKPMHVFFLHNVVAPYRLPVFAEVAKQINIEVFFSKIKTSDRKWDPTLEGYTFPRRVLPSLQIGPFFINPTLIFELMRPYDAYLVGDFPETAASTFLTILVAKLRRKPVILWSETISNTVIYYQHLAISNGAFQRLVLAGLNAGAFAYRRLLLSLPDSFAALSDGARDFLISQFVPERRIHSGIQVMPRTQLAAATIPKSASPYAGQHVLLYLGYFNPLKGITDLIAAMKQLPDPNLRLLIAGAGPEEAELKQLAADDSRIEFVGYREGSAKANLISWADLFVLPTHADCWGLVVNEALHYGTPVLVTTSAGASQMIEDGHNGIRIAPHDPGALASAISLVINDKHMLAKLHQGAKNHSDNITDPTVGAVPIVEAILAVRKKS